MDKQNVVIHIEYYLAIKKNDMIWASLVTQTIKNLQCRRSRFNPWIGKISWRREWQPTPVFLPEKSDGQRSLVGYSPLGHRVRHN